MRGTCVKKCIGVEKVLLNERRVQRTHKPRRGKQTERLLQGGANLEN